MMVQTQNAHGQVVLYTMNAVIKGPRYGLRMMLNST